jgi:hypothetical protein
MIASVFDSKSETTHWQAQVGLIAATAAAANCNLQNLKSFKLSGTHWQTATVTGSGTVVTLA